jgi:hypothetical protein
MYIHKTFSMSELIDIIEIFEMDVPDYKDYYKDGLIFYMEIYLQSNRYCNFDNEYFNIKNHFELVSYLQNPNNRFKISVNEKKRIDSIAKKIIKYCKKFSNDNFDEIFNLGNSLSKYGDLPSVRKAITLLNKYPNKPYTIIYENSIFYLYNLKKKKSYKKNFKFNKNIFYVNFF